MTEVILTILGSLTLIITLISLILVSGTKPGNEKFEKDDPNLPKVSIMVPARNEEAHIIECLQGLAELNYPTDKLEILIGDDHSTDQTKKLIEEFIKNRPHFQMVEVGENLGKAKYKTNALAHLIKKATSDYFFFQDSDTKVPKDWILTLLPVFKPKVGIVTGIALIYPKKTFLQKMQAALWLLIGSLIWSFNQLLPVTGYGPAMAMRREAYESTGGYEKIAFSFTEDVVITQLITKRGWKLAQSIAPGALSQVLPLKTMGEFYNQLKRWLTGGMRPHPALFIIWIPYVAGVIAIVVLLFFNPLHALLLILTKLILQTLTLVAIRTKINYYLSLFTIIIFEFFFYWLGLTAVLNFFFTSKPSWRGRTSTL